MTFWRASMTGRRYHHIFWRRSSWSILMPRDVHANSQKDDPSIRHVCCVFPLYDCHFLFFVISHRKIQNDDMLLFTTACVVLVGMDLVGFPPRFGYGIR